MVTITTLPFVMPFRATFSAAFSMAAGATDRASHHTPLLAFVCQPPAPSLFEVLTRALGFQSRRIYRTLSMAIPAAPWGGGNDVGAVGNKSERYI